MEKINILIVEDIPVAREVIRYFIEEFNSKSAELFINISGESDSFNTAVSIIENLQEAEDKIQLVLLDYHLIGSKNGFHICEKFPNLAYVVMSQSKEALHRYEAERANYPYMSYAINDITNKESIIVEIQKYQEHIESKRL